MTGRSLDGPDGSQLSSSAAWTCFPARARRSVTNEIGRYRELEEAQRGRGTREDLRGRRASGPTSPTPGAPTPSPSPLRGLGSGAAGEGSGGGGGADVGERPLRPRLSPANGLGWAGLEWNGLNSLDPWRLVGWFGENEFAVRLVFLFFFPLSAQWGETSDD